MTGDNDNVQETSLQDDVAAAFAKASEAPTSTPTGAPQGPDATQTVARGPDGRFASAGTPAPAAQAPLGTQTPPAPAAASTPPADGGNTAVAGTQPVVGTPAAGTELKLDPNKPPSGWTPAMKEKWSTLPEDVRQEVVRREEDMSAGVAKLRKQYEPMETVYRELAPHAQYFEHIQTSPQEYIRNVIQTEQTLTLGNPAQKMQALLDLGDAYGIPIRQVIDSAMGGQLEAVMQQSHQHHKTPPQLPPEVMRELAEARQFRESIQTQAIDNELKTFESTNPPFYNEVRENMADLLESGRCSTYQEAYDFAVWQNPELRAKSIAQQNGIAQAQGIAARQQAAGMVSTPSSAPIASGNTPPADESMEDTVRRAYAMHSGGGNRA